MERIVEQLSQLQELTNEQLSELEEAVLSEFDNADKQERTSDTVNAMTQLADAVEAVRSEQSRRVTEAQALQDEAAAAAARVRPQETAENTPAEAEASAAPVPPAPAPSAPEEEEQEAPGDSADDAEDPEDKKKELPFSNENDEKAELASETPEAAVETAAESAPEAAPAAELSEETPAEAELSVETPAEATEAAPETAETELSVAEPEEAPAAEAPATELAAEDAETTTPEGSADAELSTNENPEAIVTAEQQGSEGTLQIEVPEAHKPVLASQSTTLSITAGADIPGYSAGAKLSNSTDVAEAFMKRLHTLRNVHGGDGEQHIVASFRQEFPEDRLLTANDPQGNTDKIQGITSQESLVAAAGICLPLETKYDLGCDVGVTDRPVRDALARFAADRGGIRFFAAPVLADSAAATGFWRGDGSDPNSGTWHTYGPNRTTQTSPADAKPCLEVQCVAEDTAYIEAITLCLTFNNLTTRTFPELIKRHNELALVAHARVAENALLAQLKAGSTAITAQAQVVGATREIMNLVSRGVAAYRHKHRMGKNVPLRAIMPAWVLDLLKADLALQMPGDGMENTLGAADSSINAWFKARNVNVTWHLDGVGPAVGDLDDAGTGTAVGFELPTSIEFALFAEGTWLYLDGGTLDLGVIRDSSLVATNQYKQFVETFEGVANVGCDSFWVTADYVPSGQAAALVDTL